MTEPERFLQLLHHDSTRAEYLFQSFIGVRDKVPAVLVRDFDGDHVCTALFHLERQEAAGGTDFQNALTRKIGIAEVLIHSATQIPIPSLDDSATREFHRMVKITIGDIFHLARIRKNHLVSHG